MRRGYLTLQIEKNYNFILYAICVSDLELFQGLKKGDRRTVVLIYEKLLPKVTSWITSNSGSKADAHDIFQETLETILLKIDSIYGSFEGMVIGISRNKWIDRLRKKATSEKMKAQFSVTFKDIDSMDHDGQLNIEYNKYLLMEKYFSELSETCQKILTLIKSGVGVQDIVATLSIASPNTLYRRKAACIERWSTLVKQDNVFKDLYI